MLERAPIQTAGWTILVVDESPDTLLAWTRILLQRFANALVLTASDAPTALRLLAVQKVDLMIGDHPKGMDGTTLLALAAATSPTTMRVLLASRADLASAAQSVEQGRIHAFHAKPPAFPEVLTSIETLLAGRVPGTRVER